MYELLNKISNAIIANLNNTKSMGLDGNMGIVLFLNQYAEKYKKTYCKSIADELLERIYCNLNNMSMDFFSGLSGVGLGLTYLIDNKLQYGNADNVLSDLDDLIYKQALKNPLSDFIYPEPVFSMGLYYLLRVKCCNNERTEEFTKRILDLLNNVYNRLPHKLYAQFRISWFCTVLYVLMSLKKYNTFFNDLDILIKNTCDIVINNFNKQSVSNFDRHIFCMLRYSNFDYEEKFNSIYDDLKSCVNDIDRLNVNACWLSVMMNLNYLNYSIDDISKFIDIMFYDNAYYLESMNSSISSVGLMLMNGLFKSK